MIDLKKELAVQSFCFRNFEAHGKLIELVKECGLANIELCQKHVDFSRPDTFDDVIAQYRDAGVGIVSIGVQQFRNDEAGERNFFEFAKKAGCRFISANFAVNAVPEAYRTAEKLADEYGIRLGIHNHGGHHWLGSAQMLGNVFANTGKPIGLCLDTAWALDAGEDPVKMADRFSNRLYGIHFKDFVFDRARGHEDVVIGTGNLDLDELISVLQKNDFDGYAVLEYEGDADNPVPALKQCVDRILN